ncbi:Sialic acid TRAP transporter permease protein SiaT (plasmid) [Sulfitobacter sp. DSM 110093]|uniref:TRAP transporter permease n=1 Tax=Sulfitobacter sp. DSM 110093 TaxID=2883127 RepID=UPI001FAB8BB4|nr:TRAP transporter fused permease subunit [Sulfitobacter sp. DSM 110093]UOA33585.1 Sialic acid TRAP transporter permease protein SiaT [Sulfitobacter sp. DSM 110093]
MNDTVHDDVAQLDAEGLDRKLSPMIAITLTLISALYAVFHLAVLNFWSIDEWVYRVTHVNIGAILAFVGLKAWRGERAHLVWVVDILLVLGAIGCSVYVAVNLEMLIMRTGVVTTGADLVCGAVGTLIVLEFARRVSGIVLPIIALVFISYVFIGQWLPGVLEHSGFRADNFASYLYSQEAIFGMTVAASSRYIILFVAFAVFLQASGAGEYFMRLAMALFGGTRGGPGKVSVFSGLLFGTVSGSAVANVVASGTFTIPMMRRIGYPRESAGGIEAASSSGGQLAPPVMGAGAFIMAEITGIPYSDIVVAAVLPCLLFYIAIFLTVDLQAKHLGLHGVPRSELPKIGELCRDAFLLLPLVVLLYLLLSGYSIIAAGTWGLASTLLVSMCREIGFRSYVLAVPLVLFVALPLSGMPVNYAGALATVVSFILMAALALVQKRGSQLPEVVRNLAQLTYVGLADSSRKSLQLISVMACAGIVVGVLGLTGLGGRFSSVLLTAAGESQILAFILAMLISIVLGMGMPTTAAYAIAAAVVAPALQQMGVSALAAHMFVFYCAVISAITPPVAIAAFAGAAIAGGKPWPTSIRAMRYGIAAFFLPFMFYTSPEILLEGTWSETLHIFGTALIAVYFIAVSGEGELFGPVGPLVRALSAIAALLLLWSSLPTDVLGLAIAAGLILWARTSGLRASQRTASR